MKFSILLLHVALQFVVIVWRHTQAPDNSTLRLAA
jgi:hypothetical protein